MAMPCRVCNSKNTRTTATETHGNESWRYCRCLDCDARYKTIETYAVKKRGAPPGTPVHPNQRKKGATNHNSVLTEENVRLIRDLAEDNETYASIAAQFGIHKDTVYRIVNRKRCSHIK